MGGTDGQRNGAVTSRPGRLAAGMAPKAMPEDNNGALRVSVDTRVSALGCGDASLRPAHWMTDMKVDIDGEVDALYPYLDESAISESQEMAPGTILYHCEGIQLAAKETLSILKRSQTRVSRARSSRRGDQ